MKRFFQPMRSLFTLKIARKGFNSFFILVLKIRRNISKNILYLLPQLWWEPLKRHCALSNYPLNVGISDHHYTHFWSVGDFKKQFELDRMSSRWSWLQAGPGLKCEQCKDRESSRGSSCTWKHTFQRQIICTLKNTNTKTGVSYHSTS